MTSNLKLKVYQGTQGPVGPAGPAGPALTDGDKGDITVDGDGATWRVNDAVLAPNVYNVRRYGAVGDGVANDTNAIKTAIQEAILGNGHVYIPAGDYRITAPLCALSGQNGVVIRGDGQLRSRLLYTANTFTWGADTAIISIVNCNRTVLEGFQIRDNLDTVGTYGNAVIRLGGGELTVRDVFSYGGQNQIGLHLQTASVVLLENVRMEQNGWGLLTDSGTNSLLCVNWGSRNNYIAELSLGGVPGTLGFSEIDMFTFVHCVFDESGSTIALGPYTRAHFIDCQFLSGNGTDYALNLRDYSGGGGQIIFDGGYIGCWTTGLINGGGFDTGSSGSGKLIFNRTRIVGNAGSKATRFQNGSSYSAIYNDCQIVGTRDETYAASIQENNTFHNPAIKTGTSYSLATSDTSLIFNASGAFTLTLQAAALCPGRILQVKNIAAQTLDSASSNVKPLGTDTAGTAILSANAGRWATLQSDGTNWVIMAGVV